VQYILPTATLALLAIAAYQDFTSRAVYWTIFPLLTGALAGYEFLCLKANISAFLANITQCAAFLGVQLFVLTLFFSLRYRSLNAISSLLGAGDVLFLLALCFAFSPLNYAAFYLASLASSLAIAAGRHLLYKSRTPQVSWRVPLAGIQAALLAGLLPFQVLGRLHFFSDAFFLGFYA